MSYRHIHVLWYLLQPTLLIFAGSVAMLIKRHPSAHATVISSPSYEATMDSNWVGVLVRQC